MNILIVVAHPDDEGLGAGGTIHKLTQLGHNVDCCILSGSVSVRAHRPHIEKLRNDITEAQTLLGIRNVILGDFPNIAFNKVPHVELVKFIETSIVKCESEVIFTHHPNDLNNDHNHTSHACLAASRLWQRRDDVPRIEAVYLMEVQSSTEWSFPGISRQFEANTFVELAQDNLEAKINSVSAYQNVMREVPHPRSPDNIEALARYRGSQSGYIYSEAFQKVYGGLRF